MFLGEVTNRLESRRNNDVTIADVIQCNVPEY